MMILAEPFRAHNSKQKGGYRTALQIVKLGVVVKWFAGEERVEDGAYR